MFGEQITSNTGHLYTIQSELGRGGFGTVYLGQDTSGQECAIKIMGPVEDPTVLKSYQREVQGVSSVSHTHVLSFLGHGQFTYKNRSYFFTVTEYCPNGNYRSVIAAGPRIEESLKETLQILLGLEALHQESVHRDIKPENILLKDGILKIGDLGLSKSIESATSSLTFKGSGTPRYMAPEVWEKGQITPATDLYAMGVMLFECLTGQPPFTAEDASELREMHLYKTAPRVRSLNSSVPEHVDGVVRKLLEKDRTKRYQTVQEVIGALKEPAPSLAADTLVGLRDRVRKTYDAVEASKLEAESRASIAKEASQKRLYMEDQLISQFDEVVESLNASLQETQIRRSASGGRVTYSFNNRTLNVSFFHPNAFYQDGVPDWAQRDLKKRNVIHGGIIEIQEDREDREGWNLVLAKEPEQPYGEWLFIESDISGLTGKALRFPPAATQVDLLAQNIAHHWSRAMHTWVLKDKPFEQSDIIKVFQRFIP